MSDHEANVRRAAAWRRRADDEYRAALEGAVAAGTTYTEIAAWLGVSRQGIRQFLTTNVARGKDES